MKTKQKDNGDITSIWSLWKDPVVSGKEISDKRKNGDDPDHSIVKVLASLFNSISTFTDYLIPKSSLYKDTSDTIQPIAEEDKRVHTFPNWIS